MSDGRTSCFYFMYTCLARKSWLLTRDAAVNDARAMRVAEIMNDFRAYQHHISSLDIEVPTEDYWEEGYNVLREALSDAQHLLQIPFEDMSPPSQAGSGEPEKRQLQRYGYLISLHFHSHPNCPENVSCSHAFHYF